MNKKLVSLSVVLPCHNEEEVISSSYNTLKKLLDKWNGKIINDYEIVLVNNGSTDDTFEQIMKLYKKDKKVTIIDLRKNYGFQGSITAGVYNASMDTVVTIDADLQDDPEKIEEMLEKYYEGYDLVLGIRSDRKTDRFFKRITAHIYYSFLRVLGVKSVYNHGDFRLMSRELVEDFKKFGERNRYIRGMIFEMESKYACVYYKRKKREAGKSKFNILSLFSFGFEGITSFSNVPIKIVSVVGFIMFFVAVAGIIYAFLSKYIFEEEIKGWASTFIIISMFSGIQNLLLGIVGSYISKMYLETKGRPIFLVRKKYTGDKKSRFKKTDNDI